MNMNIEAEERAIFENPAYRLRSYSAYAPFDWDRISCHKYLSEAFIDKYANKLVWSKISRHQVLSESFIKKHTGEVFWGNICVNQKVSYKFIEEALDGLYLINYCLYNPFFPPRERIEYMRKRGLISIESSNDVLGYSERDAYLKKQDAKLKALDQLRELL